MGIANSQLKRKYTQKIICGYCLLSFFTFGSGQIDQSVNITFQVQHDQVVQVIPNTITFHPIEIEQNQTVTIYGISPGHVEINATVSPKDAIEYAFSFHCPVSGSLRSNPFFFFFQI